MIQAETVRTITVRTEDDKFYVNVAIPEIYTKTPEQEKQFIDDWVAYKYPDAVEWK